MNFIIMRLIVRIYEEYRLFVDGIAVVLNRRKYISLDISLSNM